MINVDNISFSYDGKTNALDGVSLNIADGEFVCVLGSNGSGKSTLAKHLNALLVPDAGSVTVNGLNTADANNVYAVRQQVGMVFQNPDDQLVATMVEDDVAFGPENLGVELPELRERVSNALKDVGLAGFEKHETHALSGGQKQRVAIAGVLAMDPTVLVLDEASAMLDPRGRAGLMRVCRELNARGMTIVMITHFMEEAAQAGRVVLMNKGRIVRDGVPAEVLTDAAALEALNLDVPFAARLSHKLKAAGVDIATTVDEAALASEIWGQALCRANVNSKAGKRNLPDVACADEAENDVASGATGKTGGRIEGQVGGEAAGQAGFGPTNEVKGKTTFGTQDKTEGSMPSLISFKHVSYTYDAEASKRARKSKPVERQADWGNNPSDTWALRDVELSICEGDFFGIAGHTGSGKSTLIQHMNGLVKPTYGSVLVNGIDTANKKAAAKLCSTVGVVFQYPEHQLFAETVFDDVAFGPRNLGVAAADIEARVREALAQVGLELNDVRDKSPFALSGGQQRRVAMAGILAMKPQVLVLDEPAAGLDPAARKAMLAMIHNLHKSGLTIVMVSHNMDDLAALCSRVAILNEGKLLGVGSPEEVFTQAEALKSVGLGSTCAQEFAIKLNKGGMHLPCEHLISEDELVGLIVGEACPCPQTHSSDKPRA